MICITKHPFSCILYSILFSLGVYPDSSLVLSIVSSIVRRIDVVLGSEHVVKFDRKAVQQHRRGHGYIFGTEFLHLYIKDFEIQSGGRGLGRIYLSHTEA